MSHIKLIHQTSSSQGGTRRAWRFRVQSLRDDPTPNPSYRAGHATPVELPGGALWLLGATHLLSETPVYGQTFIMHRTRIGGEGLVRLDPSSLQTSGTRGPAMRPSSSSTYDIAAGSLPDETDNEATSSFSRFPAVSWRWWQPWEREHERTTAIQRLDEAMDLSVGGMMVIDTEFRILTTPEAEEKADEEHRSPASVGPGRTALVPLKSTEDGDEDGANEGEQLGEEGDGWHRRSLKRHPRRTMAIMFTCNLCCEKTKAAVNPLAWTSGSVFVRCQSCGVVHKLKDHLGIFHEMAGRVFPPRNIRESFPEIKAALDRIAAKKNRLDDAGGIS